MSELLCVPARSPPALSAYAPVALGLRVACEAGGGPAAHGVCGADEGKAEV